MSESLLRTDRDCGSSAIPETRYLRIDDHAFACVTQGRGAPVVFVHGSNSDHRLWEPQRNAFARRYRYVAYDQRYFGAAQWPDDGTGFSPQTQIDDLAALLAALDACPAHLVGWSMSGDAVLGVALRHPALVRSVFLHEPSLRGFDLDVMSRDRVQADFRAAIAPAMAVLRNGGDLAAAVRRFMDGVNGDSGAVDALPGWLQRMAEDNARTLPLLLAAPSPPRWTCRDFFNLDVPIAITCGKQTRDCYRIVAEAAHRCLRRSQLRMIPQARHLWPVQAPSAFNAAVLDFLRTLPD